jgi:DNA gyrase subunit A
MEVSTVKQIEIDEEMRSSYIDYAMSVIVSRALPDARDGFKPVHRRILYAMMDMGMRSNTAYKKSARIVGEVLGKYHPHGDQAVYESMARMAQDFSLRYTLIDGQGNFGSIDGDSPAAMRYTEARMDIMAEEMVLDIDKNTVNFVNNFDGSLQEPSVLPARLPNMLLNGSSGIAVGMATNIPSHNMKEVCKALLYMIENQDSIDDVTVEDLMKFIPGPDFATGGIIVGTEGIRQAYSTGKGKITVQGRAQIEEIRGNRYQIRITEIPYQVNKTNLLERIANLVRSGKLSEISDLRDESDRNGMRIIVELKRNSQPKRVLNRLYKFTQLQSTFGINMLALVESEPRLLPIKRSLQIFIDHRVDVLTRRTQFELEKAKHRAHILEGLLIALSNLDEVIKTIRRSADSKAAKKNLMGRFKLSDIQAQAILDMQLRRLSQLEREKIQDEHKQLVEVIAYLEDLLAHPKKILELIGKDLAEISRKYSDKRRTLIVKGNAENLTDEDLVSDVAALVTITRSNYIKRVSPRVYRTQKRGGKGVIGQNVKDEDQVDILIPCRALHTLLFFSDRGKVYSERVFELNESKRTDKGMPIVNILALEPNERITAAIAVPDFDAAEFIVLSTENGRVKRMPLSEFTSVRTSGLIAIKIIEGDRLGWAQLTSGEDDLIMVTAGGNALRFNETSIRPMGRAAGGVAGIRLNPGDRLTAMEVVIPKAHLLVVTEKGYGKRTLLKNFRTQGRAGKGVATIDLKMLPKIGKIASARVVKRGDQITLISNNGIMLRLDVDKISSSGRTTKGARLMKLDKGDRVASVGRISDARK